MYGKRQLPLVSILIPNFNHSQYLEQCIKSAVGQTYPNKEIVLMDNSSSDDSVRIAERFSKDGVLICRNQCNVMEYSYRILTNEYCRGKYFILLCADDFLLPDFLENAVAVMEKYPYVGYVHGERDFVTPENELIEIEPFYKCSFVAPGKKVMPIYMVTTVANTPQGVIRKEAFDHIGGYDMEIDHMNVDRSLWFFLSYEYDAAYIRKKACRVRMGNQAETVITQKTFQHPILCHLTIKDYVNFARNYGLPEVYRREGEALQRLAKEFTGYAGEMLYINEIEKADDYLDYAQIVYRDIEEEELYRKYRKMSHTHMVDKEFIHAHIMTSYQHKRNYNPPQDYEEINPEEIHKWLKQEYKF